MDIRAKYLLSNLLDTVSRGTLNGRRFTNSVSYVALGGLLKVLKNNVVVEKVIKIPPTK